MLKDKVYIQFKKRFENEPILIKSPGRINLLGEHTDYNDGFVLPAAIDKYIYLAINKSTDNNCNIFSIDFNKSTSFKTNQQNKSEKHWANYLLGVVNEIIKRGKDIGGFNLVFGGNIPIGAGLSSSAALETGLAFALNKLFDLQFSSIELVKISQDAENNFVNVNCGIMDQFAAIMGKKNNFIKLDCRSLEYKYFPFETNNYKLLLCNSNVKHNLIDSEYNKRRQECENGVKFLNSKFSHITHLRDVSEEQINQYKLELPKSTYEKCSYVIRENSRLTQTCKYLNNNNLKAVGNLLYETHDGLKNSYKVSCKELDFLVDYTKQYTEILGSRMMGGGFGGCTINLIENDFVEIFTADISKAYKNKFNIILEFYNINIVNGTEIISH